VFGSEASSRYEQLPCAGDVTVGNFISVLQNIVTKLRAERSKGLNTVIANRIFVTLLS
jgi:hypothetical protein